MVRKYALNNGYALNNESSVTTSRVLSHAPNKRVWRTSKNYALNSEVYA